MKFLGVPALGKTVQRGASLGCARRGVGFMKSENDESWSEKLGDAAVAVLAFLIVAALLAPGWL